MIGTRTSLSDESGHCSRWIHADFALRAEIETCADEIRKFEPDILINNAGINIISPFQEIKCEDFLKIHQVNVFAPFVFCQAAITGMLSKNWGRIINISSIWGKISKEFRASYSASKFALDGLTTALSAEHSKNGILANCVLSGFIDTDMTRQILGESGIQNLVNLVPAKRLGTTPEIAKFILWLASEENTYLTGQNIAIDGGFTRV
ncbi:MAG: SDR family oxidoreductase [Leptospiraceae bacterium]|nr:SDR family oxidoreductase [Leptospiraceae bacterium]